MHSPTQILLCVAAFTFFTSFIWGATILTSSAMFAKGEAVWGSHMTLQPYSKTQCAEKCYEERQNGWCSIAGYNKALKACCLSLDSLQDVVEVADEISGVLYMNGDESYIQQLFGTLRTIGTFNPKWVRHFSFDCF